MIRCLRSLAMVTPIWLALSGPAVSAQSLKFTQLWAIPTDEGRPYITSAANERGAAINPVTRHVLVVSRAGGLNIAILDLATGAELGFLDVTEVAGGTFSLSAIGVAEDGVIYAANLVSPAADSRPLKIYRWADEAAVPTVAYEGNPSDGQRFGDSFDVQGAGAATQIALGTGNAATGVRFAIFTTTDGETFAPTVFSPAGVGGGNFQKGITFGPTNTIFGKANNFACKQVSFDLAAGTSSVLRDIPMPAAISPVAFDPKNNLLAGLDYSAHQTLVFDTANPDTPVQVQQVASAGPITANGNGVGAIDFAADAMVSLDTQNGLVVYKIEESAAVEPPTIVTQPAGGTVLEGANYTFTVGALGTQPLSFQWYRNGVQVTNANANTLQLTKATAAQAGDYTVEVSNVAGTMVSSNAVLVVTPLAKSGRLVPLWSKAPGDLPFLANDNAHRGLAYNPSSGRVLVASRTLGTTNLHVLDGATGAYQYDLRASDESGALVFSGGIFPINMVAVAGDGVVYACNLSTSGSDFALYRWANDNSNTVPTVAYGPDNPGLVRCGDAMDVRGSGANTQIIIPSRNGKTVAVFTTTDGETFTPSVIDTADANDGNFGLSVAFGEGNTFWGKASGAAGTLRHVQFDLNTGTGTTLHNFPAEAFPSSVTVVGLDPAKKLLAGIAIETPDNLQLYEMANLETPPVLIHQELFPADNPNLNGTGSVDFGGNRLFALDSNNGLVAFEIRDAAAPAPSLSDLRVNGGNFEFTVNGQAGRSYGIEASTDLVNWTEVPDINVSGPSGAAAVPMTGQSIRYFRAVAR